MRSFNAAICAIVLCALCISSVQSQMSLEIINPDGSNSGLYRYLVYQTIEDVICIVTNSDTDPSVTFEFENADNFPAVSVTTSKRLVGNKFSVNVTLSFSVTGPMNGEKLKCAVGSESATVVVNVNFPPLLSAVSHGQTPSQDRNILKLSCDTISLPETRLRWKINETFINETKFTYTENQTCELTPNTNYEANLPKYECRSDFTLINLSKEDIGSVIHCEHIYQGELYSDQRVGAINFEYRPAYVNVTAKPLKIVNGTNKGSIELTCKTAPANPAQRLEWFEGSEKYSNRVNMSQYPIDETSADYNGVIQTQVVRLPVTKDMNGTRFLCCASNGFKTVCGSTILQVPWISEILSPQMEEYSVYAGSDFSLPCVVDSNPVAAISWFKRDGSTLEQLVNNTDEESNILNLNLVGVNTSEAGTYRCIADLFAGDGMTSMGTVSKDIIISVLDRPTPPVVTVLNSGKLSPTVSIQTAATAPEIPQLLYIQYKKAMDSLWFEINNAFPDTMPGQEYKTYEFDMSSLDLAPGEYHVRVKSLAQNGLTSYTSPSTFQVEKSEDEVEMVTKKSFNNAIIISVFVTAAVLVIIAIVVVVLIRKGVVGSSRSRNSWNVS